MKIGILGTGDVAHALAKGFTTLGHEVKLGSRETKADAVTFAQAAQFGEIIVLATLGTATENAIRMAGPQHFKGKVVMDATNPLDSSKGMPPRLVGGVGDSGGEKNQKALPGAHVVKVFNTVGNALMFKPKFKEGQPTMFICGDDDKAKQTVSKICGDFGWETLDVGGISSSHFLESMCLVWVLSAIKGDHWNQALKMLRA